MLRKETHPHAPTYHPVQWTTKLTQNLSQRLLNCPTRNPSSKSSEGREGIEGSGREEGDRKQEREEAGRGREREGKEMEGWRCCVLLPCHAPHGRETEVRRMKKRRVREKAQEIETAGHGRKGRAEWVVGC